MARMNPLLVVTVAALVTGCDRAKEPPAPEIRPVRAVKIEMREMDEDVFRTAEELGIDLSRPERGSDEEDERRRAERA